MDSRDACSWSILTNGFAVTSRVPTAQPNLAAHPPAHPARPDTPQMTVEPSSRGRLQSAAEQGDPPSCVIILVRGWHDAFPCWLFTGDLTGVRHDSC